MEGKRPENVGIVAIDFYTPNKFVDQTDLEKFDGVGEGKYTIGLGQLQMGFPDDREDIRSIARTVVHSLLEKNGIPAEKVGRLEVGTETIIDKSKSVKSSLMELFPHGDVLGVDCVNACYGGTSALFNAIDWVESSAWNGKYALVVAGDVAIYAQGAARPTGGCGIVAMLIGPDAPLVMEPGLRGSHCENAYDFFKPNLTTQYPVVDGKLSLDCYVNALDKSYERYSARFQEKKNKEFSLKDADAVLFHTPFTKLVVKSYTRLCYTDLVKEGAEVVKDYPALNTASEFLGNRAAVSTITKHVKASYNDKVEIGHTCAKRTGNIYCGSLYGCLLSAITNKEFNADARILAFSYGSGLCATMYSFLVKDTKKVKEMAEKAGMLARLDARKKIEPSSFVEMIESREKMYVKPFNPKYEIDSMLSGTYYLVETNDRYERIYKRKE